MPKVHASASVPRARSTSLPPDHAAAVLQLLADLRPREAIQDGGQLPEVDKHGGSESRPPDGGQLLEVINMEVRKVDLNLASSNVETSCASGCVMRLNAKRCRCQSLAVGEVSAIFRLVSSKMA